MICKNCGAEIVEGSRFCTGCGARVPMADALSRAPENQSEIVPKPQPIQAEPIMAEPAFSEPETPQPETPQPVAAEPIAQEPVYSTVSVTEPPRKKVFAILSLVLGIVGCLCSCCPSYTIYVSWLIAAAGIAFGIVDRCLHKSFCGMSTAGLIFGIIGLIMFPLILICIFVMAIAFSNM